MTDVRPLPGELSVIAHLAPGQKVTVLFNGRKPVHVTSDEEGFQTWFAVHCIEADLPVIVAKFGSGDRLSSNTLLSQRQPINQAVRALKDGGVAAVRYEKRDRYGRTEWVPVGHRMLEGR